MKSSGNWPNLTARIILVQDGNSQQLGITDILDSQPVYVEGDSSNMQPGPVDVRVIASGNEVYTFDNKYDLSIIKESSPPAISITEFGWDGNFWSMNGQFSDPDGEEVDFSMEVDGIPSGNIAVSGNSWNTPNINFILWEKGEHQVRIIGCDISGKCSEVSQQVNNSLLFDQVPDQPDFIDDDDSNGLLPASSALLTIISLFIGLICVRGRE